MPKCPLHEFEGGFPTSSRHLPRPNCAWNSSPLLRAQSINTSHFWAHACHILQFCRFTRYVQSCNVHTAYGATANPNNECIFLLLQWTTSDIYYDISRSANPWIIGRLSGNFRDCLTNLQTVRKTSRLSGNSPDCPKTFEGSENWR